VLNVKCEHVSWLWSARFFALFFCDVILLLFFILFFHHCTFSLLFRCYTLTLLLVCCCFFMLLLHHIATCPWLLHLVIHLWLFLSIVICLWLFPRIVVDLSLCCYWSIPKPMSPLHIPTMAMLLFFQPQAPCPTLHLLDLSSLLLCVIVVLLLFHAFG
jgi:hypothetical protein